MSKKILSSETAGSSITYNIGLPARPPHNAEVQVIVANSDPTPQAINFSKQIIVGDSMSCIGFFAEQHNVLGEKTKKMIELAKNKDAGAVGEVLNNAVLTLRGLDPSTITDQGFFSKLIGRVSPIAKFIQQYETISSQIENVVKSQLIEHQTILVRDLTNLAALYNDVLEYFRLLEDAIVGAELVLQDTVVYISEAVVVAEKSNNMLDTQKVSDLNYFKEQLESKIQDLKLTRTVVMQALPSIRVVENLDKGLVNKIQSQLTHTMNLWNVQIALALGLNNTKAAGTGVKAVNDLNNDLLLANSTSLRQVNATVGRELMRGVYDIETIKKANDNFIGTLEDTLQIAKESQIKRQQDSVVLIDCEEKIKTQLLKMAKGA